MGSGMRSRHLGHMTLGRVWLGLNWFIIRVSCCAHCVRSCLPTSRIAGLDHLHSVGECCYMQGTELVTCNSIYEPVIRDMALLSACGNQVLGPTPPIFLPHW